MSHCRRPNLLQQSMQLPSSGQAGVVILLRVAALPAHWNETPVAVAVGEGGPILSKHSWPQCIYLQPLAALGSLHRALPSLWGGAGRGGAERGVGWERGKGG